MIYAMMIIVATAVSLGVGLLVGARSCDKQLQEVTIECAALEARVAELLCELSKLKAAPSKPRVVKPKDISVNKLFGRGPTNAS